MSDSRPHEIVRQMTFADTSDEYKEFEEKFKPKKTTDDCYTPENIYEAVAEWASRKYGFSRASIVRPFWPGADYETAEYPEGCVVLDNPPFSVLAKIVRFYTARKIPFFLFAPAMTCITANGIANAVCVGADITFANGAKVAISFVHSFGEYCLESAPDLYRTIKELDDANRKEKTKKTRRLVFPPEVATAARTQFYSVHGVPYALKRSEAIYAGKEDVCGTSVFGGCYLLSPKAAAERAAAERAAAERAAAERAAAERAAAERAAAERAELTDYDRERIRFAFGG